MSGQQWLVFESEAVGNMDIISIDPNGILCAKSDNSMEHIAWQHDFVSFGT